MGAFMVKTKERAKGFSLIAAGLVFLFNPNVHIFDVLPDFIGLLLIYRGLFAMSFSTEKLRDARGLLWKLVIITAVRIVSVLFIPGKSDSFTLLLVFSFGVLEAMYAIPFIVKVFDGFYDLGRRYDAQSVFYPIKDKKGQFTERSEKLKLFTLAFFLVKTVGSILPELTALDLRSGLSADAHRGVTLSHFKPMFYTFEIAVVLVIGIIWLVRTLIYVNGMRKDEKLSEAVFAHYENEVLSDHGMFAALQMKNVLLMFLISSVALFPLQLDGLHVFPSFIAAGVLALALRILARFDKSALYGYIPAGISAALSVVGLFLQVPYFAEYEAKAARFITNAARLYKPIRIVGTAEFVLLLVTFLWFAVILCRVFRQHAALLSNMHKAPQYNPMERTREIMRGVYARMIAVGFGGTVFLGLRAASFTTSMYYPELWILHIACSCVFTVLVIYAVSGAIDAIYERLENKY